MTIVGYGGGTDSTAMLVGLWQRQVPVDLILFADPGGEQPHTYEYLEIMERWLLEHGMPPTELPQPNAHLLGTSQNQGNQQEHNHCRGFYLRSQ